MNPGFFLNPKANFSNIKDVQKQIKKIDDHWIWEGEWKENKPVTEKLSNVKAYLINKLKNKNVRNGAKIIGSCSYSKCVNPDHQYFLESLVKNKGSRNGASKLNEEQVKEIRLDDRLTNRQLSEKYSVSIKTIQRVKKMEYWKS